MPNGSGKGAVGRQSQLPFRRALEISVKSLKIRFWRSMITAGGIFLGIAFFTVVRTQSLMQWPLPEKVRAGYVRVSGEVNGPDDYTVWTPIPVEEGIKAGIPEDVIKLVADENGAFSLATVVQGQLDAKRADKNLARVNDEWKGLEKIKGKLAFYMGAVTDADMKVEDAVKFGVPADVARKLAGKGKSFKGSALADMVRDQPDRVQPLYAAAALDQDINIDDAVQAGVPRAIAEHLAGQGRTFKAGPLNDAITAHGAWMRIWESRVARFASFKTVPRAPIVALGKAHAITLNMAIQDAKGTAKEADQTNVMLVNKGRKIRADFAREGEKAGEVKLQDGDSVYIPDRNSRYRTIWLVVMSLLVCFVGITNSMLMAVTERFKEIGTMKCLGALDKFVVELFMLESGMMGIVASVLGWLVGFVLMLLLAGVTRGWDLVGNIEGLAVLRMLGESVGVGLFLTIFAVIWPAKRAADMPPAMALRSEI